MSRGRALRSHVAADRRTARVVPDLSRYPLVMMPRHVAEIFGKTVRTVERQVAAGKFPIPRLERHPSLAFSKARVLQFFAQDTFEPMEQSA